MRFIIAFIVAAACQLAVVNAECPNACSAHGKCGAYDMCLCFRNWMSNDCSESKFLFLLYLCYKQLRFLLVHRNLIIFVLAFLEQEFVSSDLPTLIPPRET